MEIQHIRNATIRLKFAGTTFLIDPYFAAKHTQFSFAGKSKNPTSDLPMDVADIINGVDYLIISHLHPDHFDQTAQELLPKDMPVFCQPEDYPYIKKLGFKQVTPINSRVSINDLTVFRTRCQHGIGPILDFMGQASGFVFKHPKEKILYWLGDTIYCRWVKEVIDIHKPELMVCHAGGNKFFKQHDIFGANLPTDSEPVIMDGEQVMQLIRYSPHSMVIATHLNALDHETETKDNIRLLAKKNSIAETQLFIPDNGQILIFN